uniref:Uncharacterized protein n=1 Tax=Opuntia streptacantha TaxID=393608 RepID=A0A7C9AKX5_OPUST
MSATVSAAAEHLGETPTSAAANNEVGTHFLQVLYVDFLNLHWNCMCNAVSYTHEWLVVPIRALSLCTYLKAIARKTWLALSQGVIVCSQLKKDAIFCLSKWLMETMG